MSGAQFKRQNEAPPVSPVTPFSFEAQTSLGAEIKNFPENHLIHSPLTEADIRSQIPQSQQSPDSHKVSYAPYSYPVTPQPVKPAPLMKQYAEGPNDFPVVISPGEYHPGYCEQMIRFFDQPKQKEIYDTYTWKSGAVSEKKRTVPNTPPHFSEFARTIGVTTRTLKRWARDHEDFREAYETCQEIFEEFLIDNGLLGSYGAIAMKFVAVNRTKMKDKVVSENVTIDINKVLDSIAAGNVKPGGQLEMPEEDR